MLAFTWARASNSCSAKRHTHFVGRIDIMGKILRHLRFKDSARNSRCLNSSMQQRWERRSRHLSRMPDHIFSSALPHQCRQNERGRGVAQLFPHLPPPPPHPNLPAPSYPLTLIMFTTTSPSHPPHTHTKSFGISIFFFSLI